jgi:hypothetical protein
VSTAPRQTKAQRQAEQRAAQLEAFKKRQAVEKRTRVLTIALSILAAVAVVAIVAVVIVINIQPKPAPEGLESVETFPNLEATHVQGPVEYPMSPPAGGPHNPVWLNCGVYNQPVPNENAVHDLEHGAVWITYSPDLPDAHLDRLKAVTPDSYAVLSPYDGLDSPIAISAWGAQLKVDDPDDPRLQAFMDRYWRASDAPEPGAPCTGGLDAPGRE